MLSKIESVRQCFTGVIPAEPGWRVVITNGKTTYLAPVVGWAWERHAWSDDERDGHDLDETSGEAFIVANEGAYVGTAKDVVDCMSSPDDEWHVGRLLAPGKSLDDPDADGWEEIKRDGE